MKYATHTAIGLIVLSCASGCSTGRIPKVVDKAVPSLVAKYNQPASLQDDKLFSFIPSVIENDYATAIKNGNEAEAKRVRNEVIADLMTLGRAYHTVLDDKLHRSLAGTFSALDIAGITSSALATVFTNPATSSALSGISTIMQGAREAIDKNYFNQKASDAIIAKMRAARADKETAIRFGMLKSTDDYPLHVAASDCIGFIMAGSVTDGLAALVGDAEKTRADAEQRLDEVKETGELPRKFNADASAELIRVELLGLLRDPALNQLVDGSLSPTSAIRILETWLQARGVHTLAMPWAFTADADELAAALSYLQATLQDGG